MEKTPPIADCGMRNAEQGIVVSAPVLERFVSVLERLERRLGETGNEGRAMRNEQSALLTVYDVATRLGKSTRDVYRMMRAGKLRKVPGLGGRTTRFRPADVDRLLAAGEPVMGRRRL